MDKKIIKPTSEQMRAIRLAQKGADMGLVACAGAGKTSTLHMIALEMIPKTGMYLAYNKEIALEAREKFRGLPVHVSTLHSLAYRNMIGEGKTYSKERLERFPLSSYVIAQALGKDTGIELFSDIKGLDEYGFDDHAKFMGPGDIGRLVLETIKAYCNSGDHLLNKSHVSAGARIRITKAALIAAAKRKEGETKGIGIVPGESYLDMLCWVEEDRLATYVEGLAKDVWADLENPKGELPITHDVYLKKYANDLLLGHIQPPNVDYIMLDEFQDSNGVTISLAEAMQAKGSQIIAVGDPNQQIYDWRGSINAFDRMPFSSMALLSTSFRFGPRIAAVVSQFVDRHIQPGFHIRGSRNIDSTLSRLDAPSAVICRTNAGIVEVLIREIMHGRKPKSPRVQNLVSMIRSIEQLKAGRTPEHPELKPFKTYEELEEFAIADPESQFDNYFNLIKRYGAAKLIHTLEETSRTAVPDVIVMTGHGSKGLEWENVRLHDDFSNTPNRVGKDKSMARLLYVAATRATDVLDVCDVGEMSEMADNVSMMGTQELEFYTEPADKQKVVRRKREGLEFAMAAQTDDGR